MGPCGNILVNALKFRATHLASSWQVLSQGPSGDRIARSCRHTGPDLTVRWDRKTAIIAICFRLLGPFQTMIACPEIKQKQPQDRKTVFETLSLPVAKILSPVARQAPTNILLLSLKDKH